jgi:TRAP-type C4-dicarboxylate transport system permease small subunit
VFQKIEAVLSTLLLLVMVAISALQVLVRYVPPESVDLFWTEEASRLLLIWLTFWGAAVLQRTNDHMALSVVADALPRAARAVILVIVDIIVVITLGILAWYGFQAASVSLMQQTIGLGVSLAVFAFAVPISACAMLLFTIYGLWRRLRGNPIASVVEVG